MGLANFVRQNVDSFNRTNCFQDGKAALECSIDFLYAGKELVGKAIETTAKVSEFAFKVFVTGYKMGVETVFGSRDKSLPGELSPDASSFSGGVWV